MGKKDHLSDFEHGKVVGARRVFEKLLNYWGSPTQLSLAVRGKRPECLRIDRKTIVTEITSRLHSRVQLEADGL